MVAKRSKYERVAKRLMDHWGFRMYKNKPTERGYWSGCCKTGYTVVITLRGTSWERFSSLAAIERAFLADAPPEQPSTRG